MRKTISDITAAKASKTPVVCLTAYTAPMARSLDPYCDVLLVGDSMAMVLYGLPSTLQADMEMMIRHGRAVVDASENALVIVDMPFGSYQATKEEAFTNAARILKETNAAAVKCEGGAEMAETISYLAQRGIPVMGHVGLQPQSVNALGGFKAQGRDEGSAAKIMNDAKAVAAAGAFAIVIEGVAEQLAQDITNAVSCPTIGIGASAQCDGQILVSEDLLGITHGKKPKFVKEYAAIGTQIDIAAKAYAEDVRNRRFPDSSYTYGSKAAAPLQPSSLNIRPTSPEKANEPVAEQKGFVSGMLRAIPRRANEDHS